MIKLSLLRATTAMLSLGLMLALASGCAANAEPEDGTAPPVEHGVSAVQGITISLNCSKPILGLPTPPCKPDLLFGQTWVLVYAPGNAANIAPGRYVHFGFTNDSDKPTGPFQVQIKDGGGNVLKTVPFPGLAAHQGSVVIDPAPYACGWSRTAALDTGNAVDEYSESNNTSTYSYACPRLESPVLTLGN